MVLVDIYFFNFFINMHKTYSYNIVRNVTILTLQTDFNSYNTGGAGVLTKNTTSLSSSVRDNCYT